MLIDCLDQLEGPVVSRFSVVEVSTTDEDGNAKCHFVGIDIFNGDKLEETVPSSDNCDINSGVDEGNQLVVTVMSAMGEEKITAFTEIGPE
ncbi:hypothetical protein YC2023_100855 [Brassica napus]